MSSVKPSPQTLTAALPGLVRIVRRLWPQLRTQLPLLVAAFAAILVEIGLRLLEPWPLKFVVDYVLAPPSKGKTFGLAAIDALSPMQQVTLLALATLAVTGGRALAEYISTVGFALAGSRVLNEVRTQLFRHMQRLSLAYHTRARSGDLLTRLTGDIGRLQEVTITALIPLVLNALNLVGMLFVMIWLNWRLALLALSVVPVFLFMMTVLGERIRGVARKERQQEGALAASASEVIGAIKVVQALSLETRLDHAFTKQNLKTLKEGVKGRRLAAGLERTVDMLVALGTALTLWYGTRLVLGGDITLGDLLVFTTYLKNAFKPMRDVAKYTGRVAKATASGERIIDVLDTIPEIRDRPGVLPAPPLRGAVRLINVDFAYEPGKQILHKLNLTVEPGMRIALVGPSGGGKSSLVSLLLRLYDPTAGSIEFDDTDIRNYSLESLRRQVAIVLQESVLFATTVRENIAYGAPDASAEEIEAAARLANAHDFIMDLPDGYETVLGERGATLSGGQRQRIAIARAAIRKAAIMILDEPTTGLDQENERAVSEALSRLTAGCTTFLIAHNLRTVEQADLILYLEHGRVLEQGTHLELLHRAGRYATLYQLQLAELDEGVEREDDEYALAS